MRFLLISNNLAPIIGITLALDFFYLQFIIVQTGVLCLNVGTSHRNGNGNSDRTLQHLCLPRHPALKIGTIRKQMKFEIFLIFYPGRIRIRIATM